MASERSTGASLGLLMIRLALGAIFITHGLLKVVGENAPKVQGFADYLANNLNVPFPYPAAIATIASEIGGGIVILLGLGIFARLGALALAVIMGVAIFKVHWPNGFLLPMQAEQAGQINYGYEYNVALLAMALCILFAGPGKIGLLGGGGGGGGHHEEK